MNLSSCKHESKRFLLNSFFYFAVGAPATLNNLKWEVVVAQLVVWSLLAPVVFGSNSNICKKLLVHLNRKD